MDTAYDEKDRALQSVGRVKKNNKKKKQEQTRIIQPNTHILAVLYDCNITDITVNVVTHLRTN